MRHTGLHLLAILAFLFVFQSCKFDSIDYPPSGGSGLKGPNLKTLETKSFQTASFLSLPYPGSLIQQGNRFLLSGYNENGGRHALLTTTQTTELPRQTLSYTTIDSAGTIWALAYLGQQHTLQELTPNGWVVRHTFENENVYRFEKVNGPQLWISAQAGLIIWNTRTKQIQQRVSLPTQRTVLPSHAVTVADNAIVFYRNALTQDATTRFPLSDYVGVERRKSNFIMGAYEDPQKNVWLVVKEANWDGALLRYDGTSLQRIATVPYHYYDSGRDVRDMLLDKTGNLWMNVDGYNYVYLKEGKWVVPQIGLTPPNEYPAYRLFRGPDDSVLLLGTDALYQVR